MSRLVLIGVAIVDGLPDLQLPAGVDVVRDGPRFTVEWNGHRLTGVHLGLVNGTRYFLATGDREILAGLSHLGASVRLVRSLPPVTQTALRAKGVRVIRRVSDGVVIGIHPEVVWAGESPIAVGLDGIVPDETALEVSV